MTVTTLKQVATTQLNASGDGTIVLRPDVGQNWAPLFVRVSTNSGVPSIAHCAVYHGSPGVPVQPSQYIDDTFLGNGDTSSIISGTAVLFGEAVIFQFTDGTPGDTATATIYGMQSDQPPNLDLIPQVPGTHFAGHPTTEITTTATFISINTPLTVLAGNTVYLNSSGSNQTPDDVRQFSSYYIKIYVQTPLNATAFNPSNIHLFWYGNSNPLNGTLIYEDSYTWWTDTNGGAFFAINGPLEIQDVQHGPYLVVQYQNAGSDTVVVNVVLEYTTRQLPGPYARQQQGIDGIIANINDGPGFGLNVALPFHYGRLWARMTAIGAGTTNFSFRMAGNSFVYELFAVPTSTTTRAEWINPKRSLLFTASNTTYTLFMHALYDRS